MRSKIILFSLLLLVSITSVYGYDRRDRVIGKRDLPIKAQEFIDTYFDSDKIKLIIEDKEFRDVTYKIYFDYNVKLEFNKKGEWIEINFGGNGIPFIFIHKKIYSVIKKSFPNTKVYKIERNKYGFDVNLSNGLELEFDKHYRLIDVDD